MEWIPALSTTSLLVLALWLGRSLILARLAKSVENEFNRKIEYLRSELRRSEETFKADLNFNEQQIAAVRSGALSGMSSRQIALDQRRFDAVDKVWRAVVAMASAKQVSQLLAHIKFDAALGFAEKDARVRESFGAFPLPDPSSYKLEEAASARPYLTELSWALFSAYSAILMQEHMRLHMLKSGLNLPDLLNRDRIEQLLSTALPHRPKLSPAVEIDTYFYDLEGLEKRLLEELRNVLSGKESDQESIIQAEAILRASESLRESSRNIENRA